MAKVRTMPPGAANSVSDADRLAAMAYLLQANGFRRRAALPPATRPLRAIGFGE